MKKDIFQARSSLRLFASLSVPALLALACGDEIKNDYYYENYYGDGGADSEPGKGGSSQNTAGTNAAGQGGEGGASDGGTGGGSDAGAGGEESLIDPRYPDAPVMDTPTTDFTFDIFGTVGNRYWFAVGDEQRQKMNNGRGGPIIDGPIFNGGLYTPGGKLGATYVDHLWTTTAGKPSRTTDFGKVQVKVVGQSTGQPWDEYSIPNLNVDADEFVKDQRIGGYEHLRFGNGQVSGIFRERVTLELYKRFDYPAPLATFAWVSSNVWGSDIAIPYTLIERYKRAFCDRYEDVFGGGCVNMWEFAGGDFNQGGGGIPKGEMAAGGGIFDQPESCQIDQCETSRVHEFEELLAVTPNGPGFKAATADYVDWPAFHRFQCLSYVLSTGDDALHNGNNIVIVERADGKFQYLPYSIDISLGMEWYPYTPLPGGNVLARGCQADPQCWADTIAECETVIEEFAAMKPNDILKSVYDELDEHGMLRPGDKDRYVFLDDWFTTKLEDLPTDLENYRENPSQCPKGQQDCGGWCDWECPVQCVPPGKEVPAPVDDGGVGGAVGIGGAAGVAGGVVGGAMGIGGGFVPGGAAGGGPVECPAIELYPVR